MLVAAIERHRRQMANCWRLTIPVAETAKPRKVEVTATDSEAILATVSEGWPDPTVAT